ncbi:hypothetical protein Tco_0778216 [Tanacetum coccineum]
MAQVSAASGVGEVSAEVDQVLVQGDAEPVPQIPKERLVFLLCQEIVEGIRKLKALGDCGDGNECLEFLERLQLECMEKGIRLRLMMKETQLKLSEKSSFILKLRGDMPV